MKRNKATNKKTEIPSIESLEAIESTGSRHHIDIAIVVVKLLIYLMGQAIAYLMEFGAVFFCISILYLIWSSLDDRRRRRNELSAYSVFNPNCEAIDGTVTADQLKKQLTFGAL